MNVLRGKNHVAHFEVDSDDVFSHRAQLCHAIHVLDFRGNEFVCIHDITNPNKGDIELIASSSYDRADVGFCLVGNLTVALSSSVRNSWACLIIAYLDQNVLPHSRSSLRRSSWLCNL